jgi:putative drug exporter of the RND superfamily
MAEGVLARAGRWCFRRRWSVLAMWVVAAVAGGLASGPVTDALADDNPPRHIESIAARDVLSSNADTGGSVIGLVDRVDPQAPAVRDAVTAAATDLATITDVRRVATPYTATPHTAGPTPAGTLLSADGHGLLVTMTLDKVDSPRRNAVVDAATTRLHRLADDLHGAGQEQARVRVGGDPALNRQADQVSRIDQNRAELFSLPISLVVLMVVFGGMIAAGLPVVAAIASVVSAFALLLGFSRITDLDSDVLTVVTLLGLGLSVDYGLLLVARYREELASGFTPEVAVGRAWATVGRTILFSALTVAGALTGLLAFDVPGLSALGAGGVSVALVALLAALTLTAALLGVVRRWIRPSARAVRRRAHYGDAAEIGFFARLSRLVQRFPAAVAVGTTALLLVAGIPLLTGTVRLPGLAGVPRSVEAAQVADDLASRFGQTRTPAVTVVARTDPATLDRWAARWAADPTVETVLPAEAVGPGVAEVDLAVAGDPQGMAGQDLVGKVRADRPPGVASWVTGDAAVLVDLKRLIRQGLPWAIGITLLAMVALLFAMTGSMVVPVKAILANVVSLGATFGVMSAVFEHGFLAGPLHTLTTGGLDPFVIVIVFAFAFGLSMDYEVFLLGRIREYVEGGWDTDTAVRRGLQHTGPIITSAALLMMIVFACFAGARMGTIEQIGLGLAVAVLIDATIVRCLLVPATMTLLGRSNWWAPRPLRHLRERAGLRERRLPDPVPAPRREPELVH